jgi:hypothetical protein
MSWTLHRARRDVAVLVPASAGTVAISYASGSAPLLGAGVAGLTILSVLPWATLFILFIGSSLLQSHFLPFSLGGLTVGSITLRPEMAILIPLAVRAFVMSQPQYRPKWGATEFLLVGWIGLNVVTSYINSPSFFRSIQPAGELLIGVAAMLTVYTAVSSARRLRYAAKVFIGFLLLDAVYGFLATIAHYVAGTNFGVSTRSQYGAGTYGLMFEHDIFASSCAATAVILYVLWREQSDLFSTRTYIWGFWISVASMFAGLARAAWIGFFVGMVYVIVVSRRTRRPRRMERVALAMFALAGAVLIGAWLFVAAQSYQATNIDKAVTKSGGGTGSVFNGIFEKANELTNVTSGTGAARLSEAQAALTDLHHSPAIGLGTFTYDQRHPLKFKTNYIGNIWLRAIYDTGILGFLMLVAAIGVALWPTRTLMAPRGSYATIARALTFGWVPLVLAYAATDDTLFMWPWIFLGLIRAARLVAARQERIRRAEAAGGAA